MNPGTRTLNPRRMVAREAARLLYTGSFSEYKHAKEVATRSLGFNAVPSNYEVAVELDILADEIEGEERRALLIRMRREALRLMRALADFEPRLIGSVWRGTARRGSDIDIVVYSLEHEEVVDRLAATGFIVEAIEEVAASEGRLRRSHHLAVRLCVDYEAEVVVRPPKDRDEVERCDIYGDPKLGLNLPELEKLMMRDPLRKLVPQRRWN